MIKVKEWMRLADEDLRVAEIVLDEGIYNQTCFHSQHPDAIIGSLPDGLPNKENAQEAFDIAYEVFSFVKGLLIEAK
ncbi:MAG: HEPN domain-containing protein [bacterium]